MENVSKNVIDRAVKKGQELGLHHRYIFQNNAAKHQNIFEGYGTQNLERLRKVRDEVESEAVFEKLVPGHFGLNGV